MSKAATPVAPDLPEVAASGPPFELGEAHGRTARKQILAVYQWRLGEIIAATGETEGRVLSRAERYLPPAQTYVPDLIEEVEGIARGSGIGFRRAFFLQVATEVSEEPFPGPHAGRGGVDGCSAVGTVLDPRRPVIAQNWDQPATSAGKQLMLRLRPREKPEVLMFTHAGVVGYIGMNELGLGHVGNGLYADEAGIGLTHYFVNRRLLEYETVQSAVTWMSTVTMASACNYLLADAAGGLADVELADGGAHQLPSAHVFAHTNHYTLTPYIGHVRYRHVLPDSSDRLATLNSRFVPRGDVASVLEVLTDHSNYPTSVCRHEEGSGLSSRASIVMWLREREMSVAYGPPCVTHYRVYRVGRA